MLEKLNQICGCDQVEIRNQVNKSVFYFTLLNGGFIAQGHF